MNYYISDSELYHFGIKGQKWGIRRYQNPDGSLTALGKQKYGTKKNFEEHKNKLKKRAAAGAAIAAGTGGIAAGSALVATKLLKAKQAAEHARKVNLALKIVGGVVLSKIALNAISNMAAAAAINDLVNS